MKILHVSNFFYGRGGDCTYLFSLMKLLEKKGHKNLVFSMHHPQNISSEYSRYFVSYINYAEEIKRNRFLAAFKVLFRTIYSSEARKKLESLIKSEKPDIAHLQNIHHHITPSIFYDLKKHNIPIVWTLHDYTIICPNTSFQSDGKICEKCKKNRFYMAAIERCKKGSFGASSMAMIETIIHRIMNVYKLVDYFLTPSEFLRNKLIEYGMDGERVICLNNFVENIPVTVESISSDNYIYVGRLNELKGIRTLIDAAIKADTGRLLIVGDGELKEELVSYVNEKNKNHLISFLGHISHEEVIGLIGKCRFSVLPSEWYENFPYSVLESFACGRPVIGSNIGGIPELINDGKTGLLFECANSDDLSSKIKFLQDHLTKAVEMGENAREFIKKEMVSEKHYDKLIKIYNDVLNDH